jgi:hypothetical protein
VRLFFDKLLSALLPCGTYTRDTDGTPLVTIDWFGITETTHAGIERALVHNFKLMQAPSQEASRYNRKGKTPV